MARDMSTSVVVDFEDIYARSPELARALIESPTAILAQAGVIAKEQLRIEEPEYAEKVREVTVRINRLPDLLPLRKLSSTYIGKLVSIEGIVVRATPVRPLVVNAVFKCLKCDQPIPTGLRKPVPMPPQPRTCPYCKSKGPFELDEEKTEFVDYQEIRVQEKPEDLPPGQLPRWVNVRIIGSDLVDVARPGDRVVVTGIVRVASSSARKGLEMYIEANNIEVATREAEAVEISPEEEEEIRKLAKDPNIHEKIIRSIAPSIYGYEHIKEAIMYLLFGGVTKELPDVRKRGDIHVLLIGDPGTGKSALLQYVARIAPRGLYTSGRGSTAAGLTAAVVKEAGGGMSLEAGALVLADKGVACLHPDTHVLTDSGVVRIVDLAENARFEPVICGSDRAEIAPIDVMVASLEADGKVGWRRATLIRRKWHRGTLLKLRLRSGFEILLTDDHLLLSGSDLTWRPAGEFKPGDLVVAPLKLPEPPRELLTWDVMPEDCKVYLTDEERAELREKAVKVFGSISKMAEELGVSRHVLYESKHGRHIQPTLRELKLMCKALRLYEKWRSRPHKYYRTELPARLDGRLGYILGFITGDGAITRSGGGKQVTYVSQSVKHDDLIKTFFAHWRSLFKDQPRLYEAEVKAEIRGRKVESVVKFWRTRRKALILLLKSLGKNLEKLPIMPLEFLRGFLAGLLDSDGCVSVKTVKKQGKSYMSINVVFTFGGSREANLNLLLALRRFGVYGHYDADNNRVVVSSRRDCTILLDNLRDLALKARKEMPNRIRDISGISERLPIKPVSELLSTAFDGAWSGEVARRGLSSVIWEYTTGSRWPTETQVRKILERAGDLMKPNARRQLEEFLAKRGYFLDEIVSVEKVSYEGWVYDLYVPETHNFVAEGIMVHNCIDEIEKMRPEDRVAIHEALEQQTISIAKGGIVATLNARTAVLAAANPALGRYDPYRSVVENISLPITILSRFDLIFVIRDVPEKERDAHMAEHILETHRAREASVEPPIPPELLRKYISYAKMIEPKLTDEAIEKIRDFYLQMRSKSEEEGAPIAITARQLESLIRIAEARARAALREYVTAEDAEAAINIMKKSLQEVGIDLETKKLDIDVIMTGKPKSLRDKLQLVVDAIGRLDEGDGVSEEDLIHELEPEGLSESDIRRLLGILLRDGMIFEVRPGRFRKV